jgi:hypothetical protein
MINQSLAHEGVTLGRPLIDGYFKLWAFVLPIASVLIFPSVQGTTAAYLMAFASLPVFLAAARIKDIWQYLKIVFFFALAYLTLNLASQFFLSLYGDINLGNLNLVDPFLSAEKILLRPSLFSQTLYLSAGLLTFLFVFECYRPSWDPYIFAGILLLAGYGFYELLFYKLTGTSGDFLSNRVFNDRHSGSLFQTFQFGGTKLQRMKSLTGEPSMFAFTVLPYWIFALHTKRYAIGGLLTLALFLSSSTTAIIGMFIYGVMLIFSRRIDIKYLFALGVLAGVGVIVKFQAIAATFNRLIIQKFAGESISGSIRLSNLQQNTQFWWDAPLPTKFFGLGFGYIRSSDFFSMLLVNNGIIGLMILILLFAFPVLALGSSQKEFGLKCALVVILVSMLTSVPEFAYLPVWLFLGISYRYLMKPDYSQTSGFKYGSDLFMEKAE